MAGLRDFFRARPKSQPPTEETVDKGKGPALPSPEPETQQAPAEPEPEPAPGPLPLFRPDSNYVKVKAPVSTEIGGSAYDSLPAGEPPTTGTYPLHGNARHKLPRDVGATTSIRNGSISGNRTSSAVERSSSKASTQGRRRSGVRPPSSHRGSLPPGTALSTDEPVTRTFSFGDPTGAPVTTVTGDGSSTSNVYSDTSNKPVPVQTETQQPVKTATRELQTDQGPKQVEQTPAVPAIPGQYRGTAADQNGTSPTGGQVTNRHARVTSVSSKTSTSSRTPIADEFASSTWYGRESSPTAPSWSPLHGDEASTSQQTTQSSEQDRTVHQLRHQSHDSLPNEPLLPPTKQSQPSSSLTFDIPPSRGRKQKRSIDRPPAIPLELRDAPWNRQPTQIGNNSDEQDRSPSPMAPYTAEPNGPLEDYSSLQNALPVQGSSDTAPSQISTQQPANFSANDDTTIARSLPDSTSPVNGSSNSKNLPNALLSDDTSRRPVLGGVVGPQNTEDTTTHEEWKPAVVHETVKPTVHHVHEEQITREHHTHSVYHRILPIVDTQVLPTKHYVPAPSGSSGLVEVPAESIPGRTADGDIQQNRVVTDTISGLRQPQPLSEKELQEPRSFTARSFEGTEGDYKEWIDENGVKRSETTWIHPPTFVQAPLEPGVTDSTPPDHLPTPTHPQTSGSTAEAPAVDQYQPSAKIAAAKALDSTEKQMTEPSAIAASAPPSVGTDAISQSSAKIAAQAAASKLAA